MRRSKQVTRSMKLCIIATAIVGIGMGAMGCSQSIDDEDSDTRSTESLYVDPVEVTGTAGADCESAGAEVGIDGSENWLSCKLDFDEIASGEYEFPNEEQFEDEECNELLEIAMEVYDGNGQEFDWASNIGIAAVLVKGGPDANFYAYDDPVSADEGLHAPQCPGADGEWCGLSFVTFCIAPNLDVSKTAEGTFTSGYEWTIDKSVDTATWDLFDGDSGVSNYDVDVDASEVSGSYTVVGEITIENNQSADAVITDVTDAINGFDADVDCGEDVDFPFTLEPGDELVCTYEADLGSEDPGMVTNVATVEVSEDSAIGGGSAEVDVIFDATAPSYETVTIDDSWEGELGECSADDAPCNFNYSRTFVCNEDEGTFPNTATIVETQQQDSASVEVNCYDLDITQVAPTLLVDRQYLWEIDKVASPNSVIADSKDQEVEYTITVDLADTEFEGGDFLVSGSFSISNPNPVLGALINEVTNVFELGDGSTVTPDISCFDALEEEVFFPHTLDGGASLSCLYSYEFDANPCPEGTDQCENTVSAELQNFIYDGASAIEDGSTNFFDSLSFFLVGEPNGVIDECVDVADTNWEFGDAFEDTEVCVDDELPAVFRYTRIFNLSGLMSDKECKEFQDINTATATAQDSMRVVEDSAVVTCEEVIKRPGKKE